MTISTKHSNQDNNDDDDDFAPRDFLEQLVATLEPPFFSHDISA